MIVAAGLKEYFYFSILLEDIIIVAEGLLTVFSGGIKPTTLHFNSDKTNIYKISMTGPENLYNRIKMLTPVVTNGSASQESSFTLKIILTKIASLLIPGFFVLMAFNG